jgi:hydroxyacylglutathione hydrolase
MDVFCYLVACEETRQALYVDPAGDTNRLLNLLQERGLQLRYIVNTHGHGDHTCGNAPLQRATGAKVFLHRADAHMAPKADVLVNDGDDLVLGSLRIRVIHTPGHTPGAICLYAEGNLFTGDTIFVDAVGRTDLPGGDFGTLLQSIRAKVLPLPPETVIWPGHDYGDEPKTTLARQCRTNPYITDFLLDG